MSYTRASTVFSFEKALEKIRRSIGKLKPSIVSITVAIFVASTSMGEKTEQKIICFSKKIASKVNAIQRSIEESLVMSSLYIGFLLTVAITVLTVFLYVTGG